MILQCQSLSEFVPIRVASWLVSSLRSEMPNLPILPILPQSYFLCVLGDLCGVRAIMQNKPNSQNYKTNVTYYGTQSYSNIPLRAIQKNKAKQTQLQPKTRALLDPERSRRANQTQFVPAKPDQTQFSSVGKTWQKTTQINEIRAESPHKIWGRKAGRMRSRKVQECWEVVCARRFNWTRYANRRNRTLYFGWIICMVLQ